MTNVFAFFTPGGYRKRYNFRVNLDREIRKWLNFPVNPVKGNSYIVFPVIRMGRVPIEEDTSF